MKSKITMKKDLELNSKLIEDFREAVNSNRKFIELLENMNNSNKMNAVYSAMDWITVGVEGTRNLDIKLSGLGYDHKNSLSLIQYLIMIDQINMSIKLLHDILQEIKIGPTVIEYPFERTKTIFMKPVTDDIYFKHLRASFGMHPTDLRKGTDGLKSSVNRRFYASWPAFDMFGEDDFIIQVYNDSPGYEPSEILGINLEKLNRYISERYQTLNALTQKVCEVTYTIDSKYKNIPITFNNDNVLDNINILKEENLKRLGRLNGGYEYLINYLESSFETSLNLGDLNIDEDILKNYNNRLREVLLEIKENLEKMNREIISIGIRARGYEFEKIMEYLTINHDHKIGEEYFRGLAEFSSMPNNIIEEMDFNKKRYVFDAFLFSKVDKKKEILYKDILDYPEVYISRGLPGFTGYFV